MPSLLEDAKQINIRLDQNVQQLNLSCIPYPPPEYVDHEDKGTQVP